LTLNNVVAAV